MNTGRWYSAVKLAGLAGVLLLAGCGNGSTKTSTLTSSNLPPPATEAKEPTEADPSSALSESQKLVKSFAVARSENGFALLNEPLLPLTEANGKRWLDRANTLINVIESAAVWAPQDFLRQLEALNGGPIVKPFNFNKSYQCVSGSQHITAEYNPITNLGWVTINNQQCIGRSQNPLGSVSFVLNGITTTTITQSHQGEITAYHISHSDYAYSTDRNTYFPHTLFDIFENNKASISPLQKFDQGPLKSEIDVIKIDASHLKISATAEQVRFRPQELIQLNNYSSTLATIDKVSQPLKESDAQGEIAIFGQGKINLSKSFSNKTTQLAGSANSLITETRTYENRTATVDDVYGEYAFLKGYTYSLDANGDGNAETNAYQSAEYYRYWVPETALPQLVDYYRVPRNTPLIKIFSDFNPNGNFITFSHEFLQQPDEAKIALKLDSSGFSFHSNTPGLYELEIKEIHNTIEKASKNIKIFVQGNADTSHTQFIDASEGQILNAQLAPPQLGKDDYYFTKINGPTGLTVSSTGALHWQVKTPTDLPYDGYIPVTTEVSNGTTLDHYTAFIKITDNKSIPPTRIIRNLLNIAGNGSNPFNPPRPIAFASYVENQSRKILMGSNNLLFIASETDGIYKPTWVSPKVFTDIINAWAIDTNKNGIFELVVADSTGIFVFEEDLIRNNKIYSYFPQQINETYTAFLGDLTGNGKLHLVVNDRYTSIFNSTDWALENFWLVNKPLRALVNIDNDSALELVYLEGSVVDGATLQTQNPIPNVYYDGVIDLADINADGIAELFSRNSTGLEIRNLKHNTIIASIPGISSGKVIKDSAGNFQHLLALDNTTSHWQDYTWQEGGLNHRQLDFTSTVDLTALQLDGDNQYEFLALQNNASNASIVDSANLKEEMQLVDTSRSSGFFKHGQWLDNNSIILTSKENKPAEIHGLWHNLDLTSGTHTLGTLPATIATLDSWCISKDKPLSTSTFIGLGENIFYFDLTNPTAVKAVNTSPFFRFNSFSPQQTAHCFDLNADGVDEFTISTGDSISTLNIQQQSLLTGFKINAANHAILDATAIGSIEGMDNNVIVNVKHYDNYGATQLAIDLVQPLNRFAEPYHLNIPTEETSFKLFAQDGKFWLISLQENTGKPFNTLRVKRIEVRNQALLLTTEKVLQLPVIYSTVLGIQDKYLYLESNVSSDSGSYFYKSPQNISKMDWQTGEMIWQAPACGGAINAFSPLKISPSKNQYYIGGQDLACVLH